MNYLSLVIFIFFLFYFMVIRPLLKEKTRKNMEKFNALKSIIEKAVFNDIEMNKKIDSDEIPSDEDILLYYKMYLKKFELDRKNEWNVESPLSFEKFQEQAKKERKTIIDGELFFIENVGWSYIISKSCDSFIYDTLTGKRMMWQYRDYKKLVLEEEERRKCL